ncbi:MAG: DinB family protein [Candidatus Thorarchaeota archaeon]|jgi:uncharacterized damage-inducible protein DinB
MMPVKEILEALRTNNRINLFLIDKISAPGMKCTLSKRGGRDVALQFAHMHNNRVWHLQKRAKDLSVGLKVFPSKVTPSKAELKKALTASQRALETFFTDLVTGKAKRRGFRKGVATSLAYFVAHESHHRGSILLTLKESGHALKQAAAYAIWDWDRR